MALAVVCWTSLRRNSAIGSRQSAVVRLCPTPQQSCAKYRRDRSLERTAGTRHIVTHIQMPFEDIPFVPKFSLHRFAIDRTITTASPYTSNICCSMYVFRGLAVNLQPYATLFVFLLTN